MIQSHYDPYKSLKEHVLEVGTASEAILNQHDERTQSLVKKWIVFAINFHDLGKAIIEFQRYINNPTKYRGRKIDKAHTPVSLFWWCAYAKKEQINPYTFIAVAAVVWKHHGDFPLFSAINGLEYALDSYDDHIQPQLKNYPKERIENELGIKLPDTEYDDLQDIEEFFFQYRPEKLGLEKASDFRLQVQFLFSVLLESDRAFLTLYEDYKKIYFTPALLPLPIELVEKHLQTKEEHQLKELNSLRTKIRNDIIKQKSSEIATITLPTGMGKTMIAAAWALNHRNNNKNIQQKAIIVLPFLSIVDQTVTEYRKLFKNHDPDKLILEAHSLAERKYCDDSEEEEREKINNSIDFLKDTWHMPFVITTFDQFLLSLFSSKGSHQIRFHNLVDSLIIIDEIQAIPTELWKPLATALNSLTKIMNSKVLIMSATQPGFINTANELVAEPETIFSDRKRYRLVMNYNNKLPITDFIDDCIKRLKVEWNNKRVMIVLNTRTSARMVLDALEAVSTMPIYFLSADVIPQERLDNIIMIKKNNPCLVIATQCIEAGVDIDLDLVIRDFAPLDSIIQVAGRCNRNGKKQRCNVEIVRLVNASKKEYCGFVYKDNILIESTLAVLNKYINKELNEEDIFPVINSYYNLIKIKKDKGEKYVEDWAYWRKEIDVRSLLRGDSKKIEFVVIEQDKPIDNEKPLYEVLESAFEIEDRWERKRSLGALRGRITKLTVSVWARPNFSPTDISDQLGPWYLLNEGFYQKGRGIDISKVNNAYKSTLLY